MTKPRASLRHTALIVLLTAAVALPTGMWLAGTLRPEAAERALASRARAIDAPAAPATPAAPAARDIYSANIRGDPYVLAQQRMVVEAMERACRLDPATCPQARAARRYLDAQITED